MNPPKPICNLECLNGGECLRSSGGPVCVCPSTFSGDQCEVSDSDIATYIIIAVVLSTGIFLIIAIYVFRCWKGEARRPQIVQRIISVHARQSSIKIDKTKDDAPPEYDDISKSSHRQNTEQRYLTTDNGAGLESPSPEPPSADAPQLSSDQTTSDRPLLDSRRTVESEPDGSFSIDIVNQPSEDDTLENKSSREYVAPDGTFPPSYTFVQENRASKVKCDHPATDEALRGENSNGIG